MSNLVAILALVAFLQAGGITCTNIFKIEIETADKTDANTDDYINMKICNNDKDCCETLLDNPNKDDFQRGAKDTFRTSAFHNSKKRGKCWYRNKSATAILVTRHRVCEIIDTGFENCDTFDINDSDPNVAMRLVGKDGWTGKSVKITLIDGTTFNYNIEQEIDDDGSTDASFQSKSSTAIPHVIDNVKVTTSNDDDANTDDDITMKICIGTTMELFRQMNCCETKLDHPSKDDFEKGNTDTFGPSLLNECETFEIDPTSGVEVDVIMKIKGDDGWLGESVVIKMNTGETFNCQINDWIDGDSTRQIQKRCDKE